MAQDHTPPPDPDMLPEDGLEKADVEAGLSAARHRHHPVVRVVGWLSEAADQLQLSAICAAVVAAGAVRQEGRVVRSGLRMMAAHVAANSLKRVVKTLYRRTRPQVVLEEGEYRREPGVTEGGHERSFPSGHAAGAVAVAAIVAHRHPNLRLPAYGIAGAFAAVQVPRAKHYPGDVVAGAVLGFATAWAVTRIWDRLEGEE